VPAMRAGADHATAAPRPQSAAPTPDQASGADHAQFTDN
jgi:hypothetical protein